jgi:ATP-dependent RNA helicase DHX57
LLATRRELPAFQAKSRVLDVYNRGQVVVISGGTGCGKSTQIPQLLLDEGLERGRPLRIICTQPRRISAVGLAERVAAERCEPVGRSVGYRVRLESRVSEWTLLEFVTVGVLLRQLTASPDPVNDVDCVVVDEVHERSSDIDFLLLCLRALLRQRPLLKVVLMSATLDAQTFASYFGGCETLSIDGRAFPVTDYYLDDVLAITRYTQSKGLRLQLSEKKREERTTRLRQLYGGLQSQGESPFALEPDVLEGLVTFNEETLDYALMETLLWHIIDSSSEGGVLVFLPGAAEINRLLASVRRSVGEQGRPPHAFLLVPLHGQLSSADQKLVFKRCARGQRKIVFATNIAETSITVDDVEFVIDSGKMKQTEYDAQSRIGRLEETWVAQANATQRRGRAGRVKPGVCYKLFSREKWANLLAQPVPELHRTPLDQLCLHIRLLERHNPDFCAQLAESTPTSDVSRRRIRAIAGPALVLASAIEPPDAKAVQAALASLQEVKALDAGLSLTPLGMHLAKLPLDVKVGKVLLFACLFGCLGAGTTIAALLSVQDPFLSPPNAREEARTAQATFVRPQNDYLTRVAAFDAWHLLRLGKGGQRRAREFASDHFLSHTTLETAMGLRKQFVSALASIGFIPRPVYPRGGEDEEAEDEKDQADRPTAPAPAIDARLSSGAGLGLPTSLTENDGNARVVAAVVFAGLYPNLVKVDERLVFTKTVHGVLQSETKDSRDVRYYVPARDAAAATQRQADKVDDSKEKDDDKEKEKEKEKDEDEPEEEDEEKGVGRLTRVFIHPRSVNFHSKNYAVPFLTYMNLQKTSKLFVQDSCSVGAYAILLFGGELSEDRERSLVCVDTWIKFRASSLKISVLIRALRVELDKILALKIANPELELSSSHPVVKAMLLLMKEG